MHFKNILIIILISIQIYSKVLNNQIAINNILITSENKFISTGSYTNQSNIKLKNFNIFKKYFFLRKKDINPFISGGFGFSTVTQNNIKFNPKYIKAGFGVRYKYNKNIDFLIGYTNSYITSSNIDKDMHSLYATFEYQRKLKKIQPFLKSTIKYNKINKSNINGINLTLDIGFFTSKKIATLYSSPIYQKFYLGYSFFNKNLSKNLESNNIYTLGSSIYWQIGKKIDYKLLKNLSLVINIQKNIGNNNFEGSKIGASISFKKF